MSEASMFKKELILKDIKADTNKEVLSIMAKRLEEKGFVKDSYEAAIVEREGKYPTGLPTEGVKVALPHTDTVHVKEPAIAVGILEKPISFEDMGSGEELDIEIVFMLAVKEPSDQVNILQKLIGAFADSEFLLSLKNSKDSEEAYGLLLENI